MPRGPPGRRSTASTSRRVLPRVGGLVSGDRRAYAYLPASVARFPKPRGVRRADGGGRLHERALRAAHRRHRARAPRGEAAMTRLARRCRRRPPGWMRPQREALLEAWLRALADTGGPGEADARVAASGAGRAGRRACASGRWRGCCVGGEPGGGRARGAASLQWTGARDPRARSLLPGGVLHERPRPAGSRRRRSRRRRAGHPPPGGAAPGQRGGDHRRLLEAQEQAAHAAEKARELERANEALRKSEAGASTAPSRSRSISSVAHRIASVLDPDG